MIAIPVFEIVGEAGNNEGYEIKQQKKYPSPAIENAIKIIDRFQVGAERIKCKHVKSQVRHIGMDKAVRDKTIILVALADGWWIENKVLYNLRLRKAANGNKAGNNDDDQGYAKFHRLFF